MLVNMTEMLTEAEARGQAVACFDTPNIETIQAVIRAAEAENSPVILAHAQSMDGFMSLEELAPEMVAYARAAKVPVCVHLDHGEDRVYVDKAMNLGFTSVMYDLSDRPYEENVQEIARLCEEAHARGITVEAELGVLNAGIDDAHKEVAAASMYTDPVQAADFVARTGVDALTVCFGTAHGQYKQPPKLDIPRVAEIRRQMCPECRIVMHGSSGVDEEQIRASIAAGVTKINYYSGLSRGCSKYIYSHMQQCGGNMHWHAVHKLAQDWMVEHARCIIRQFKNNH
ncbi:MAG: class II fructose-bisphosphate aldolase [Lachnospiraceae bacterium]|nr:class II fructose-bisphosphate aldolase [Lachnospiraceae bacterium]